MVGWSWSPAARAATSVLERFLAGLAEGADHVDRRTPPGVGTTHHP
jgi:hypothetical protein